MSINVQLMSDVHLEFHADEGESFVKSLDPRGVDVLVLAGDVVTASLLRKGLELFCRHYANAIVLYVPGNHDYYGSNPADVQAKLGLLQSRLKNLRVLQNSVEVISGVRFAGTTLWFRDDPDNRKLAFFLHDFRMIGGFDPWVYEQNRKAEAFIHANMASMEPADIVITHHLPSVLCVAREYEGSPYNRFFVAPIADELPKQPKFWFFGHTHTAVDMMYDGCRFLCNPLGYPHECKPFNERLIVTVGEE